MRHCLLRFHKESAQEQEFCQQIKAKDFARAYKDNEVDMEEEKKLVVMRTKESMPFGMKIR